MQAKKREQERLKALGERRDECNQMLEGVLAKRVAPLDTDIKALKEALGEVDALAAMDGPGEVKETLVTELRAWLETVEGAWAERRAEREAVLAAASKVLPFVEADSLRKALDDAAAAGVSQELLSKGHELLKSTMMRDKTVSTLTRLVDGKALIDIDIEQLRRAWVDAANKGVSMEVLAQHIATIRAVEAAAAPRELAAARIEKLLAMPIETLDTAALRAAKSDGADEGVASALLSRVDGALAAAATAQMLRDAATTSLLALAAPGTPNTHDMDTLRELLPSAPAAGVPSGVIEMVTASLAEAEEAKLEAGTDLHKAHCHRRVAASKRTADRAPSKMEETAKAVTVAQDAEAVAERECAAVVAEADMTAARVADVVKKVGDVDSKVAGSTDAIAGWKECEAARLAAVAAESLAQKAIALVKDAKLAVSEAKFHTVKAKGDHEWAKQVAEVVDLSRRTQQDNEMYSEALAAAEKAKEMMSELAAPKGGKKASTKVIKVESANGKPPAPPGGGGGCCSRPSPKSVIDPDELQIGENEEPKEPLPHLVDEISWGPLTLPSGSAHQIELLLAFALSGLGGTGEAAREGRRRGGQASGPVRRFASRRR